MAITKTIYDNQNCTLIGSYWDDKGNKVTVEDCGTLQQIDDTLLCIKLHNDDVTVITQRINHKVNARMESPVQHNLLFTAWANPTM
jgi:hypothetical protein